VSGGFPFHFCFAFRCPHPGDGRDEISRCVTVYLSSHRRWKYRQLKPVGSNVSLPLFFPFKYTNSSLIVSPCSGSQVFGSFTCILRFRSTKQFSSEHHERVERCYHLTGSTWNHFYGFDYNSNHYGFPHDRHFFK
jgi:hypothetical protein